MHLNKQLMLSLFLSVFVRKKALWPLSKWVLILSGLLSDVQVLCIRNDTMKHGAFDPALIISPCLSSQAVLETPLGGNSKGNTIFRRLSILSELYFVGF